MRRFLAVAGASLLILIGVLMVAFLSADGGPPFAFLAGAERATVPEQRKSFYTETEVYSIKADVDLFGRARKELEKAGYEDVAHAYTFIGKPNNQSIYARGDVDAMLAGFKSGGYSGDIEQVSLIPEHRYSDSESNFLPAPGWVGVVVSERAKGSWFTRFRDWLGL